MYYEEKVIDGRLCYRTTPDGAWVGLTQLELTQRLTRLQTDHARCVQRGREMARCVIMLCEANNLTHYASYNAAQQFLTDYPEEQP